MLCSNVLVTIAMCASNINSSGTLAIFIAHSIPIHTCISSCAHILNTLLILLDQDGIDISAIFKVLLIGYQGRAGPHGSLV